MNSTPGHRQRYAGLLRKNLERKGWSVHQAARELAKTTGRSPEAERRALNKHLSEAAGHYPTDKRRKLYAEVLRDDGLAPDEDEASDLDDLGVFIQTLIDRAVERRLAIALAPLSAAAQPVQTSHARTEDSHRDGKAAALSGDGVGEPSITSSAPVCVSGSDASPPFSSRRVLVRHPALLSNEGVC